jgi:hypothetical protein
MSSCNKPVGPGTVQYLCREEAMHDGPCACPEVAKSNIDRARWAAEQEAARPPAEQEMVPSRPMTFRSFEDRVAIASQSLRAGNDIGDLPPAIQSWMMGSVSQLSLVELWDAWTSAMKQGELSLTLTGEQIESLVPPRLRR